MHDPRQDARVIEHRGQHGDKDDRRQHGEGEDKTNLRVACDRARAERVVGDVDRSGDEIPEDELGAGVREIQQLLDRFLHHDQHVWKLDDEPAKYEIQNRSPDHHAPGNFLRPAKSSNDERDDGERHEPHCRLGALGQRAGRDKWFCSKSRGRKGERGDRDYKSNEVSSLHEGAFCGVGASPTVHSKEKAWARRPTPRFAG